MDGNPMGAALVPGVKRAAYCAPSGTHYQKAVATGAVIIAKALSV